MMGSNFILYYAGREGSSPIIDGLASHPNVSVTVFEHLEKRNMEQFFTPNSVGNLLSSYFSGHVSSSGSRVSLDISPKTNNDVVYGLKFRPWGNKAVIIKSLLKHKAVILSLMRRDIVNHALSIYYTSVVLPKLNDDELSAYAGHPQFKLLRMSSEERDATRKALKGISFNVDAEKFIEIMTNIGNRRLENHEDYVAPAAKRGVKVKRIYYEDFCSHPENFFRDLLTNIGLDYSDKVLSTKYTKVNSTDMRMQVSNIQEIESHPEVREYARNWNKFLSE